MAEKKEAKKNLSPIWGELSLCIFRLLREITTCLRKSLNFSFWDALFRNNRSSFKINSFSAFFFPYPFPDSQRQQQRRWLHISKANRSTCTREMINTHNNSGTYGFRLFACENRAPATNPLLSIIYKWYLICR